MNSDKADWSRFGGGGGRGGNDTAQLGVSSKVIGDK